MSVVIRKARLVDAESISELMQQLGYAMDARALSDKLDDFATENSDSVFVADKEGQVIGFVSCHITRLFHQPGCSGRITSLVVDQALRGNGIGQQLVAQAEAFFTNQHCKKFEVTSGMERTQAHRFYQSLGYQADNLRFIKAL